MMNRGVGGGKIAGKTVNRGKQRELIPPGDSISPEVCSPSWRGESELCRRKRIPLLAFAVSNFSRVRVLGFLKRNTGAVVLSR